MDAMLIESLSRATLGQRSLSDHWAGRALDTTPVVELENLKVTLGRREILHGITCRLGVSGKGKAVGLLGPNGGQVDADPDAARVSPAQRRTRPHPGHGLPPQHGRGAVENRLHARERLVRREMTAVTFLRQMAELSGLPPRAALEKAHEVLFHVGLGESRYRELRTYSTG